MLKNVFPINSAGLRITTGAASANTALPITSSGAVARYIRILPETGTGYIKLGVNGVTATTSNILVSANVPLVLPTGGLTHIGYIQSAFGAASINVVAIDI